MQMGKIFVVYISMFILIGMESIVSVEAQAPNKPTLAVSSDAAGGNIWVMDTDGENQRPILEVDGDPVPLSLNWSPDGEKLIFHTHLRLNTDIYIVDGDGQNLKRLTDHEAEDAWPDWHPSGQRIAFSTNRDGNFDIYAMTPNGDILKKLVDDPANDLHPAWTRDGRKLAFSSKRGRTLGDVYTMDANGQKPSQSHQS